MCTQVRNIIKDVATILKYLFNILKNIYDIFKDLYNVLKDLQKLLHNSFQVLRCLIRTLWLSLKISYQPLLGPHDGASTNNYQVLKHFTKCCPPRSSRILSSTFTTLSKTPGGCSRTSELPWKLPEIFQWTLPITSRPQAPPGQKNSFQSCQDNDYPPDFHH